jgi:hypothetical protein
MKKTVLSLIALLPLALSAQQVQEIKAKNNFPVSSETQVVATDLPVNHDYTKGKIGDQKLNKLKTYSYVEIGKTFYDLQTNASIGRRIMMHPDGTVSAVWTQDPTGATNFPNRGTGYNYNNGSAWGAIPTNRIETARTGWPSIGVLANGSEFTMGHVSSDGGWVLSKNTGKGKSDWTATTVADDGTNVPIWGRAAAGGNTIHLIGNYFSSTADGIAVVTRNGVSSPTTYSRSKDGGTTWDKLHTLLPGYDSTTYLFGGGDNYAIDVRDSIVAILIGGVTDNLLLWKSTNNGDDFTMIDVERFPFAPYNSKALIPNADRAATNDGSVDVMIDATGKVHAFWGRSFISDEDTTDEGYSFYPGTASLMHWAEGDTVKICGTTIDMDGDNTLNITAETTASLTAAGDLPTTTTVSYAARNGNTSVVTMPSAGVDANGNLYVTYSSAIEETYHVYNANYRDVLISYSTDGGKTWMGPQNLTQERNREAAFPCISKINNNFIHLLFQLDDLPGTNLQNNGNTGLHPVGSNSIMYAAIPTQDILNGVIGQNLLSSKEVVKTKEVFVVSQNYPNPFDNQTTVTIYLRANSDLNVTVQNALGQQVLAYNLGEMNAGNHELVIDGSELPAGVYFYTIGTEFNKVTRKMQITK